MRMFVTDMEIEDHIHVTYRKDSDSYEFQFGEIFVPDISDETLARLLVEIAKVRKKREDILKGNERGE